jgi:hypothetical protein
MNVHKAGKKISSLANVLWKKIQIFKTEILKILLSYKSVNANFSFRVKTKNLFHFLRKREISRHNSICAN